MSIQPKSAYPAISFAQITNNRRMLYDFHKYQNGQTPDSVHATYLVYGSKAAPLQADGDVEMASSMPEQDGDSDAVSTTTVTLVAEDKLQGKLPEYVSKRPLTRQKRSRNMMMFALSMCTACHQTHNVTSPCCPRFRSR